MSLNLANITHGGAVPPSDLAPGGKCKTQGECLPCARPACYFYYAFPRFNPQVHHFPMQPRAGDVMMVLLGSGCEHSFHQKGGPKELPEGRQLRELMGIVVET